MAANLPDSKVSTLLFIIPRVSHLLMFPDALHHNRSLLLLLAEFLNVGTPEVLYTGYDSKIGIPAEAMGSDMAMVKICIPGKQIIRKNLCHTIRLFADNIREPGNRSDVVVSHPDQTKNFMVSIAVASSRSKYPLSGCLPLS